MRKLVLSLLLVTVLCAASASFADLAGSSAKGWLLFQFDATNYFDPANGYVPAGYGNVGGFTVTIDSAIPTFGFSDGANLISAAFTGNLLTITQTNMCCGAGGWQMTFTDTSFTGFTKKSGDTFTFGGLMSSYDTGKQTLTVSWQGDPGQNWKYSASFAVPLFQAPTPEPSGLLLLGSGSALLAGIIQRRLLR